MKLFYAGPSPFVRKALVVLEETGNTDAVEKVDGMTTPIAPNPAVTSANPIGKIPCLITEDGQAIYDSRVITRYLDNRFSAGLYPEGDAVWRTLTLEAHVDGMLDAAILCVYEIRCRDEDDRSVAWVEGQRARIYRGLDSLEADWAEHLAGPLDMGHVGVGCLLEYLDFRAEMGGFTDWREGRPNLAAWGAAFAQRPSMVATAPA
ncbi:MAG: glutathione S-transferase [Pikeienuella sp.]